MSLPSVRECLQLLDRMRDTSVIVGDLDRLNDEMWQEEPAFELTNASQRLTALHQLCLHMAANMSGGFGVPPTIAQAKPKPSAAGKIKASPTTWSDVHTAQRQYSAATPPLDVAQPAPTAKAEPVREAIRATATTTSHATSDAVYFTPDAAAALGLSVSGFLKLKAAGGLPAPLSGGGHGQDYQWPRAAIDALARERAANPVKRGRPSNAARAARQAATATTSPTT